MKYLARYTHRVAISNRRLRRLDGDTVEFAAKDYAAGGRRRLVRLGAEEFSGAGCSTCCRLVLSKSGTTVCWPTGAGPNGWRCAEPSWRCGLWCRPWRASWPRRTIPKALADVAPGAVVERWRESRRAAADGVRGGRAGRWGDRGAGHVVESGAGYRGYKRYGKEAGRGSGVRGQMGRPESLPRRTGLPGGFRRVGR